MVHGNKFRARIDVKPGRYDLGCYKTLAEARIARLLSEKEHFGHFTTWKADRDSALPMGEQFLSVMVRDGGLFVIGPDGVPFEVTDVKQLDIVDEVNHVDGDRLNNDVSNLKIVYRLRRPLQ